jgi:hypothetical protein
VLHGRGEAGLPAVLFEYFGATGMTVVGPVTGRSYRFDRKGARVEVDPGDRARLFSVPNLREIPNPGLGRLNASRAM